jgi:hypothetical protein
MSFIISETGSVVIILPYVRAAVKSAETHTHHTHNVRTHYILFASGHDKFKTLSLLSVWVYSGPTDWARPSHFIPAFWITSISVCDEAQVSLPRPN